jgi:hypothetical protein
MDLTKNDTAAAKQLGVLISAVDDLKKIIAGKPIPKISLKTDPRWCQQNPGEAAEMITVLRDGLIRAIGHLDRAKHKDTQYRDERSSLVAAFGGRRSANR